MSSTTKLLPCPFCSNADISIKNESPKDNSGGYFIECPGCGASTSLRFACGDDPTHLLAEQWNRRTVSHCLHQIQEPAAELAVQPEDIRNKVTLALGLSSPPKGAPNFAWSYLLDAIRELVKCEEELTLLKA